MGKIDHNDYIGQKFNKLTIIDYAKSQPSNNNYKCQCECGNIKWTRYSNLKDGLVKSCGCLAESKLITQESFIQRAMAKWGNRFDYTKTKYIDSKTKVEITCNQCHNVIFKAPYEFLNKKDECPHCAGNYKRTTAQFIKECQSVHGNKYNYLRTVYKNTETKIEVICNKCRLSFFVIPNEHIKKFAKCPHCTRSDQIAKNIVSNSNKQKRKIERKIQKQIAKQKLFINKAILKHGNKYDYSNTILNRNNKVKIYCNTCCSVFEQTPCNHLLGSGCQKCNSHTITKNVFIAQSLIIHGNKYDYSKSQYVNLTTAIEIICGNCNNSFWQKPSNHLSGRGCTCSGQHKIVLKDGTICDSLVEAYYYLLFKNQGISFKYHQLYGVKLGQRLYDFYLEKDNKYIEITGYNKGNYHHVTGKHWISYLRNIVIKKRYVEKIGATFEFIQQKKLKKSQRLFVCNNVSTK